MTVQTTTNPDTNAQTWQNRINQVNKHFSDKYGNPGQTWTKPANLTPEAKWVKPTATGTDSAARPANRTIRPNLVTPAGMWAMTREEVRTLATQASAAYQDITAQINAIAYEFGDVRTEAAIQAEIAQISINLAKAL